MEIILHSCSELLKSIREKGIDECKLEDYWLKIFQDEHYDAKEIVNLFKSLYESALLVHIKVERQGINSLQRERELNRELTYKSAALFLDCSVSTIKRLVFFNKLKPIKYNSKNVRITIAELESYKTMSRVTS